MGPKCHVCVIDLLLLFWFPMYQFSEMPDYCRDQPTEDHNNRCESDYTKWYYDERNGRCQRFADRCPPPSSRNNFETEEICQRHCENQKGHAPSPNQQYCKLRMPEDHCASSALPSTQPKWYYDIATGCCRLCNYQGPKSFGNKFPDEAVCLRTCIGTPPEFQQRSCLQCGPNTEQCDPRDSDGLSTCKCRRGFTRCQNDGDCEDLDECRYPHLHQCTGSKPYCCNTVGGFFCSPNPFCEGGHIPTPDPFKPPKPPTYTSAPWYPQPNPIPYVPTPKIPLYPAVPIQPNYYRPSPPYVPAPYKSIYQQPYTQPQPYYQPSYQPPKLYPAVTPYYGPKPPMYPYPYNPPYNPQPYVPYTPKVPKILPYTPAPYYPPQPYVPYTPKPQIPYYPPVVPQPYKPPPTPYYPPMVPQPYKPPATPYYPPVVPQPYKPPTPYIPPQPYKPAPYLPPQPFIPLIPKPAIPYYPPVAPQPYKPPTPYYPPVAPQPYKPMPYYPPQPYTPAPYYPPVKPPITYQPPYQSPKYPVVITPPSQMPWNNQFPWWSTQPPKHGGQMTPVDPTYCERHLYRRCSHDAECIFHFPSQYACHCRYGTYGDGFHCHYTGGKPSITYPPDVIMDCRYKMCHSAAVCRQTHNSAWCECMPGFAGNGENCVQDTRACMEPFDERYRHQCGEYNFQRWFYLDQYTRQCKMFWYGTCARGIYGLNIFSEEQTCVTLCNASPTIGGGWTQVPIIPKNPFPQYPHIEPPQYPAYTRPPVLPPMFPNPPQKYPIYTPPPKYPGPNYPIFTPPKMPLYTPPPKYPVYPVFTPAPKYPVYPQYTPPPKYPVYPVYTPAPKHPVYPVFTPAPKYPLFPVFTLAPKYPVYPQPQFPPFTIAPKWPVMPPMQTPNICSQPCQPGLCGHSNIMFYFNPTAGQCQPFVYSGCGGNENKFSSLAFCQITCQMGQYGSPSGVGMFGKSQSCLMRLDHGYGRGNKQCDMQAAYLFYYNFQTGACESFYFSGCGGNGNRFRSHEECTAMCGALRYGGGSIVNAPYFPQRPPILEKQFDPDPTETTTNCVDQPDMGPCREMVHKWYFDSRSGRCDQFTYGGCEGNGNRYDTQTHCETMCAGLDPCTLPMAVGTCSQEHERFYFDQNTQTCGPFTYTGCGGNANNFMSFKECATRCGGMKKLKKIK